MLSKFILYLQNKHIQKYYQKIRKYFQVKIFYRNSSFEGKNIIYKKVTLSNCKIGFASYVGPRSVLINTELGRYCSIGPDVKTVIGSHPTKNFVSTCPAFYSLQKQNGFSFTNEQLFEEFIYIDPKDRISIKIGNDVWIGAHVLILEGTSIGDGAIIATGAVVSKNVEPYSIVGGVPAKLIRNRFNDQDIEFLKKFKWWNKDFEWIKSNYYKFKNIELFIKNFQ
jgi:acetyltransferase-like isoleucine patch superfamily enzyme